MIPKKIFTLWFQFKEGDIPPLIKRCIESQRIPGYEHTVITLDNYYKGSTYVNDAMAKAEQMFKEGAPNYANWIVKASDWLRCYYIYEYGGLYLDGDMEVLPGKNFDDLLDNKFFTEREVFGFAANAGFGAEPHNAFLKSYIDKVEANFKGDGDLVYEPGIRFFADHLWAFDLYKPEEEQETKLYNTKMFFPYHHGSGNIEITPETKVFHHYANSWCADEKLKKIGTDYENKDFTEIFKQQ